MRREIRAGWASRKGFAVACVLAVAMPLALIVPIAAGHSESRLTRLEGRVDELTAHVAELESALGIGTPSTGPSKPALEFVVPLSGSHSVTKYRIRQLQRRSMRLEARVAALETALSMASPPEALEIRLPNGKRRSAERRPLRAIERLVTRLERRVEAVDEIVSGIGPPPTPAPSPSATPSSTPSPTPSAAPSPSRSVSPPGGAARDAEAVISEAGPRSVTCPGTARQVQPGDDPQAAINAAGTGGSLCFKPGMHRLTAALRPLTGQVLTFEPGATLSGARIVTNWTKQGSNWVSTGQTQNFPSSATGLPDTVMCGQNPGACIYEDLYMDGKPLSHVMSLGALADKMFIADNPSGHTMEATVVDKGIVSPAVDVTIRGATIEKFAYNGIGTAANRWTIDDTEVRFVHLSGISLGGTGHLIRNNRIHHSGILWA